MSSLRVVAYFTSYTCPTAFGANIQTVNLMTESHWVRTEICPKLYSNAQPEHLNEEEQLGGGG